MITLKDERVGGSAVLFAAAPADRRAASVAVSVARTPAPTGGRPGPTPWRVGRHVEPADLGVQLDIGATTAVGGARRAGSAP
jgi:hypothetical protein